MSRSSPCGILLITQKCCSENEEKERTKRFPQSPEPALFLNLKGRRLSTRAIDWVLRQLGREAKVELSAHALRHTCLTNLVRRGNDFVLEASVAGQTRLETTHRYRLPSTLGS